MTKTHYITSTPGVIGGKPAIAGTRIPIEWIIYLLGQGYTVKAIHEDYPWVKTKVLKGVIEEVVQIVNVSPDVTKIPQIQTTAGREPAGAEKI